MAFGVLIFGPSRLEETRLQCVSSRAVTQIVFQPVRRASMLRIEGVSGLTKRGFCSGICRTSHRDMDLAAPTGGPSARHVQQRPSWRLDYKLPTPGCIGGAANRPDCR